MPENSNKGSVDHTDILNAQIREPENSQQLEKGAKWLNNNDELVEEVFGFNENAELVNGRSAMIGFLMLIITELLFNGQPVTHSIFGIN